MSADGCYISLSRFCEETLEEVRGLVGKLRDVAADLEDRADDLDYTTRGTMSTPAIEAFEREYATRSGLTVAQLHAWGRFGAPCDCGEPDCEGFQMLHLRDELLDAGWTPPARI